MSKMGVSRVQDGLATMGLPRRQFSRQVYLREVAFGENREDRRLVRGIGNETPYTVLMARKCSLGNIAHI
jgi:hypothetical protein